VAPRLSWLPAEHPSPHSSRLHYGSSIPPRRQHFTDVTRQRSGLAPTHSTTPRNRPDPDGYDSVGPLPPPPIRFA
jgi:hypothetical protein